MSADSFFNEGAPSAIATIKAMGDRPGTTLSGPIVEIGEETQQKDVNSGAPAFWPDGNPKTMLPITIATDIRDPNIVDDDGHRTLWVSGNLKKAIGAAIRQAGAKLALGGTLSVTFAGFGEAKSAAFSPPRMWTATYTPPAPGQGFFEQPTQQAAPQQQWPLQGANAPAPQWPQQPAQPQPAPQPVAAPPAAPQMSPEQYAAYQAWQASQQAQAAQQPPATPQPDYAAQMGFSQPAPLPPATDKPPF